jgi:hypothetical protein
VTVSSAQNVAVTVNPNILGPEVDPRLPAPGASGNVCTSDGSKWISAAPTPGGITGPTDSTLTQTGTTLGLNLNNENVWTAAQVFTGGLNGYVSGTGLVPIGNYVDLGAYGKPFNHGYFNKLLFNSSVIGMHETTLQQSAALGYNVHNVLELPNASGTLALTSDVIPYVAPGPSGNVLTSDGTAWTSAALPADADTLASVTARGATTSVPSSFTGGLSSAAVSAGSLNVQTPTTSTVGATIEGSSGQTANLQEWQDSTGAVLAKIRANGYLDTPVVFATIGISVGGTTSVAFQYNYWNNGFIMGGDGKVAFAPLGTGPNTSPDVGIAHGASAAVLKVTDGSTGDGTITAKSFRLKAYTVATLPAGTQGDTAFVTDAQNPTYLGTLTGGGTVVTPVFYDGTTWRSY